MFQKMLHVGDFIEVYCLSNNKKTRGIAERESATFGCFSLGNASVSKFTTQIYPHLYPQMIGLCGSLTVKNYWGYSQVKRGSVVVEVSRIKPDQPYGP